MATSFLVRNKQPGPTVFAVDATNTSVVEWKGAGDPMGEDLQQVPADFIEHVQFQRALTRGIFEIEDAPEEILRIAELHRADWDVRQEQQRAATQASIDQAPQNDMLMVACIGPAGKGKGETCGVQVPVRQRARNESPPLCGLHKALGPQYVTEETTKFVDGKPEVKWIRMSLGARTQQD
jgi:hypothetical protein